MSIYLKDEINSAAVNDVLFIVKENHPPLIEGWTEVETTAYLSETIQLSI